MVYSPREERFNVVSHAIGFVFSCIALTLLITHKDINGNVSAILSFTVYGLSMLMLYGASTLYHASTQASRRSRMRVIDHAAIYVLIAGTYTPFMVIVLDSTIGWVILSVGWAMAVTGSILKVRYTGQYQKLSTSMYVAMGWLIIFAINPLRQNPTQMLCFA